MDKLTGEVVPILVLCAVIAIVVRRLPRIDLGHSAAFRFRRIANWVPLGLTYAFLIMGRYNLVSLKELLAADHKPIITGEQFGDINAVGSVVYGLAFLLNGPLTDRWGGRITILIAAAGSAACNAAIGVLVASNGHPSVSTLTILYALNMYCQSFGAVAIVKVNASWFHLRERGTFGGIFGILISVGLYLAYDWAPKIADIAGSPDWMFYSPAIALVVFFVLSWLYVRDTPGHAGLADFDVADASSGDTGPPERAVAVIKRMLTSRIILTIAFISMCSGFLRQGVLQWYRTFATGVLPNPKEQWVFEHWGMVSCVAGITGGMFAGVISDHLFHSRRPPVSTVLFTILLAGAIAIVPLLGAPAAVSCVIAVMAMAVIGVHGMLSGVASQDFGGRRNAGTATGLIDGFVYYGTALVSQVYGRLLPEKGTPEARDLDSWYGWPIAMIPVAVIGLALSLSVWSARVRPKSSAP
jgi:OPA family glycerol-3-phosphate transporter-like MFS transporter